MIDLKYHISTLAAVFLALGIGILVGSTMVGNDGILGEQQALIEQLENEFDQLRRENRLARETAVAMEKQKTAYNDFLRRVFPLAVRQMLADRKLLIIQTGDFPEINALADALSQAGAQVGAVIKIKRGSLALPAAADAPGLNLSGNFNEKWGRVAELLVTGVLETGNFSMIQSLEQLGYMEYIGENAFVPDAVILAGGGSGAEALKQAQALDISLAELWCGYDIPVVGVEKSDVRLSYIKTYQSHGLTTIDNAETIQGQLALVLVLAQNATGSYGIKTTAQELMPAFSF